MSNEAPSELKSIKISHSVSAITAQPIVDNKLNPFDKEWHTGYFDSCSPVIDGVLYCLCASYCAGRVHGRAGEHFFTCCVPGATQALRTKIRMAYGIRGTLFEDCLASCCAPCFLMQMMKELDHQHVADPYIVQ